MSGQSAPAVPLAPARTRWLAGFALLGLATSSASTWVHYQLLNDPTYTSVCDINATFSCAEAYTSRFGALAGVPVALLGLLFFALVLGLTALCVRSTHAAASLPGYVFALSTAGLAMVLYLAYASFVVLETLCLLCLGTYVATIGLFVTSGAAAKDPMTSLPGRAVRDLRTLLSTPSALSAALAFLAAAGAAVVLFPEQRASAASSRSASGAEQAPAVPEASRSQVAELEAYLAGRPRIPVMVPTDGAAVVIVKFNDYQCPACKQTHLDYKPVLARWAAQAPGKVKLVTRDFPLEPQCNRFVSQQMHPAACEAAVAVRLAREKGKADAMEEWLYANQTALTPEFVKEGLRQIAGVTDFDARYPSVIELVKGDVAQAGQLRISATPTLFLNGIQMPGLRAEFFDAAIAWELRRVAGGQ
jgi:uncharacterized membrane protein/protein-disulfide isomerase